MTVSPMHLVHYAPPDATPPARPAPDPKFRLAMAARIAAGVAACPAVWDGPDPRGTIAREAWAISGRLVLLAETGGC